MKGARKKYVMRRKAGSITKFTSSIISSMDQLCLGRGGLPVAESAEPAPPPQTLGPGLVYFPKIIDSIEASFSYQFDCDKPVSEQSEEVEVTAIIENPDRWSKSLVLVPKTKKEGNFSISFPIDLNYLTEVSDAIGRETGVGGMRNFNIKADVRTIAQTDVGTVDEVYTQILEGKLEGNTLTFGEELSQSQSGSIGVVMIPTGSEEGGWKTPWLGGSLGGSGLSRLEPNSAQASGD